LKIIVCIKQVPDTTEVKIDPEKGTLIREGVPTIINPFDKNAIEEGLRLKEAYEGELTVITMGPPQAKEALREALAMGVDEAILVSDRAFGGADTLATSYTLAQTIRTIGEFDLILCGKQAIDGDTAQVGPGIGEHLGLLQVTYVQKIREFKDNKFIVERVIEGGYEVIEVPLPCLLTVEKAINEPRFPTMLGMMKAHKREIPIYTAESIGADPNQIGSKGSATQVRRTFAPERHREGEILQGETEEVTSLLIQKLLDAKVLRVKEEKL